MALESSEPWRLKCQSISGPLQDVIWNQYIFHHHAQKKKRQRFRVNRQRDIRALRNQEIVVANRLLHLGEQSQYESLESCT